MIRRIRRRFIRIALLVLALAMVLLALVINVANWVNTRSELSQTLAFTSNLVPVSLQQPTPEPTEAPIVTPPAPQYQTVPERFLFFPKWESS